MYEITSCVNTG